MRRRPRTVTDMDRFFQVADIAEDPYQRSRVINRELSGMTPDLLSEICRKFGLEPIRTYLDTRSFLEPGSEDAFSGFIRCFDTWLLQKTGGERTRLVQVGKALTGQEPTARNGRLLRLEIACEYFGQFMTR